MESVLLIAEIRAHIYLSAGKKTPGLMTIDAGVDDNEGD